MSISSPPSTGPADEWQSTRAETAVPTQILRMQVYPYLAPRDRERQFSDYRLLYDTIRSGDSRGAHFRRDNPQAGDLATSRYTVVRQLGTRLAVGSEPVRFTRVGTEMNPQFAQIAAPTEMVVVASFDMRIGDQVAALRVLDDEHGRGRPERAGHGHARRVTVGRPEPDSPRDDEPLGFLCLVAAERDRPQLPSDAEAAAIAAPLSKGKAGE